MKKITQTTLEGFEEIPGRRKGNTTRQIDHAIQILFSGKICKVIDHAGSGKETVDLYLFDKILRRLRFEHWIGKDVNKHLIRIDRKNLEIELLENPSI